MTYRWIEDELALNEVIDEILTAPRYAIDTEFHREKTYYPQLALVQISWRDRIVLIDPLAIDPRRLGQLFNSNALAVVHAAQQDLEVLKLYEQFQKVAHLMITKILLFQRSKSPSSVYPLAMEYMFLILQ